MTNVDEVRHERPDVEQRPGVEEHVRRVDARPRRHEQALRDQRAGRQHRRVRPAVERGRVDRAAAARRRPSASGSAALPAGDELLVLAGPGSVGVVADPARVVARPAPGRPAPSAPTSSSCQTTTAGARSSMTNASSSGCWRQFAGQNIAPISQHASSSSWMPERVLAEPQHAVAGPDPARATRRGPVDASPRPPVEGAIAVGERRGRVGCGRDCAARRRANGGRSPPAESKRCHRAATRRRIGIGRRDRRPIATRSTACLEKVPARVARPASPGPRLLASALHPPCCPPLAPCRPSLPARLALPCRARPGFLALPPFTCLAALYLPCQPLLARDLL